MNRTVRMCALVLAAVAVLGTVSCSSSGGPEAIEDPRPSTTATSPPVDEPDDSDQIVWQESTGGGFVPAEFAAGEVPDVTIYSDGRILVHVSDPEGRPGGPVALNEAQIPAEDLDAFLRDAESSGLLDAGTDFGSPGVTDQPSTSVFLRTDGRISQVDVYAFGLEFDRGVPGVTDQQAARRKQLKALLARARAFGEDGEPYVPERVKAVRFDPSAVVSPPTTGDPWPGPPMSSFPAPTGGEVQSCLVIEGDDARAVYAADQENPETSWEIDGQVETIVVVPLVPGQEGCPPS